MRLPDGEKSRIVLIGSARYQSGELPDVPAIENNLAALGEFFTHASTGIVTADNCVTLANPVDQSVIGEAVTAASDQAEDLLVIYYAGHGLLSSRHDLYLSTTSTIPGSKLPFTGVDYAHIRDACLESCARTRVVILDCCYSGRAIPGALSASDSNSVFHGQIQVAGTYVLAASPGHAVAKAHPGEPFTAFTGELLRTLTDGIPGGEELLSLNAIYKQLYTSLRSAGNPIPQQQITENADVMALGRNSAYVSGATSRVLPDIVIPHLLPEAESEASIPLSAGGFTPGAVIEIPSVPRTRAGREDLIRRKPPKWDYLLYASSLHLGMESLRDKWDQYEAGRSARSRRMSVAQLCRYADSSLDSLQKITHNVGECLSQELQDKAFEQPEGEENPNLIMRMASNLVGVYEDYMDWAMDLRGIVAPHRAARLIEMNALIADPPIRQVRSFMQQYVSEMDALNERYATSEVASVSINLTLKIDLDQDVLDAFLEERTRLN